MSRALEEQLTRHLERRADAVEVRPDIAAVIGATRVAPRRRGQFPARFAFLVGAAALVIVAVVVTAIHTSSQLVRTNDSIAPSGPANGAIAFPVDGAVKMIDPITRHVTSLTAPGLTDQIPAWAPDGNQFVYEDAQRVTVFTQSSGATRVLGECPSRTCTFAWSPDGSTIAAGGRNFIQLFDANRPGAAPKTVDVAGMVADLNWTPDSQRLIFILAPNGSREIDTLTVDAPAPTTLLPASSHWFDYLSLAISPDGTTIAWLSGRAATDLIWVQLMTANIDGTGARTTRADLGICFCNLTPGVTWSPDGTTLALAIPPDKLSGGFLLVLADPDGANERALGVYPSGKVAWRPLPDRRPSRRPVVSR